MGSFSIAEPTFAAVTKIRELSLAADCSLRAGEQDQCIALITQIYCLLDNLNAETLPDWHGSPIAADTATWVVGNGRYGKLVGDVFGRC